MDLEVYDYSTEYCIIFFNDTLKIVSKIDIKVFMYFFLVLEISDYTFFIEVFMI